MAFLAVFAALALSPAYAEKPAFPRLTGRIVDTAEILDAATEGQLNARLEHHEQTTGEQVVIVTVPFLNDIPIEDYGYQLGRHWGIGQKGQNNGALLIVAPNDRQVRIETGYGLEDRLTDAESSLIIHRIILPAFRTGDIQKGVTEGAFAILSVLGGEETAKSLVDRKGNPPDEGLPVGFIVLLVLFLWMIRRSNRGAMAGPLILGTMLGRSRGGFSSGGGGFFGGGGSFGGGGASGRW